MSQHPEGRPTSDASDRDDGGPADLFEGPPRSTERIDRVLALVRREWVEHKDERFFQFVKNFQARLGISAYASILEDDALIALLDQRTNPSKEQGEKNGIQE
ncbi:hypothetical protein [Arthrobacter sp. 2MCAF14]|uniref:hypothetical protein n=1 Tax=Arthrobacter sp. 2MCAF14 TaxID=3232982 RepID=UPI003F8E6FBA